MPKVLFVCFPLAVAGVAVAAAEPAALQPVGASARPVGKDKLAGSRDGELREFLDGLTRQIAEINASVANLGSNNAAALRFRAVSLTAYQRAWAELSRSQVDFGDTTAPEMVAALAEARP